MTKRQYKKQAKKRKQIIQDIITDVNAKYPMSVIMIYNDRLILTGRCNEIALETRDTPYYLSNEKYMELTLTETVKTYCMLEINDIPTCRLRETVMTNMKEMYPDA